MQPHEICCYDTMKGIFIGSFGNSYTFKGIFILCKSASASALVSMLQLLNVTLSHLRSKGKQCI